MRSAMRGSLLGSTTPSVPEELRRTSNILTHPVFHEHRSETDMLRYLRRLSLEPLRFILTVATVVKTLDESFYRDLPGTLLEGIGRLLAADVKIYVAPMSYEAFCAALEDLPGAVEHWHQGRGPVTLDTLAPSPPTSFLLDYLHGSGRLAALAPPS